MATEIILLTSSVTNLSHLTKNSSIPRHNHHHCLLLTAKYVKSRKVGFLTTQQCHLHLQTKLWGIGLPRNIIFLSRLINHCNGGNHGLVCPPPSLHLKVSTITKGNIISLRVFNIRIEYLSVRNLYFCKCNPLLTPLLH